MLKKVSDDEQKQTDRTHEKNSNHTVKRQNEDGRNEDRKSVVRRQTFVLGTLIAVIFCLLIIYLVVTHVEYKGYRVIQSNETDYETTAQYVQFCGKLLKYTGDGVSCINENGDVVWSTGVSMKMPVVAVSEEYAAVADLNGNAVSVFGKNGLVSNQTMPYAICDVDVANQGAFAVVLESDKTNYINLYNKNGSIIYEAKASLDKTGYPLDMTISSDGQKLFVSYIKISGTKVKNTLVAYNFGSVGQNTNADRIMDQYDIDDEVVTKVEFIDNDTIVAFGTDKIRIYSMKEKPSLKSTINVKGEIRSVFYNEEYIGIIQNEETKSSEKTSEKYRIVVYNLNGREKFKETFNFAYNNVYASEKEIILTGGEECLIYRLNGSIKFQQSLDGVITNMIPSGKKSEYVVVYNNATDIIHLQFGEGKNLVETNATEQSEDKSEEINTPDLTSEAAVTEETSELANPEEEPADESNKEE